ncbi:MAG: D-alanine--D-alanine ligase [Armatimonadetes bacterium]|nr:D-alanine--D-alanine ligase [Armatimonadota bacterium]
MKRLRIAVLMGGPSPEREVSMTTGRQIVHSLDPQKYSVLPVEITKEGKWLPRPDMLQLTAGSAEAREHGSAPRSPKPDARSPLVRSHDLRPTTYDRFMESEQVDVAFIAMHGPFGEDGTMQGLLELLGIPYTGSGVLASALAMDKLRSRQIFEWHDIPVPGYRSITTNIWRDRGPVHQQVARDLGYPCVVKPNAVGSSIGVSLVREPTALDPAVELAFTYGPVILIEEHISGTELACGIVDDPATGEPVALPLIEIVPHADFYTYDAKYAAGGSEHIIPARVSEDVAKRAQALAVRAHKALGCEGMSRVDMIARSTDIVVLEVNTIPGMTGTSLLPDAARAAGISFPDLLSRLVENALRRKNRRA